ncbi:MAG: histidine phosphatase family protein [Pseudomonadota bacterium]
MGERNSLAMYGAKPRSARWLAGLASLLFGLNAWGAHAAEDEKRLIDLVRTGQAFAIMRHALAPGTGDPANFDVNDCKTQRNLSATGRTQATAIGARLRSLGLEAADVMSSAWCRCQDTARLLKLGPVTVLPALNSFFQDMANREPQTRTLRHWLTARTSRAPLVLVTHQVNVSALTGRFTTSGAIIVASLQPDGGVTVHGRLEPQ